MKLLYTLFILLCIAASANALELEIFGADGNELDISHIRIINAETGELVAAELKTDDNSYSINLEAKKVFIEVDSPNHTKYFLPLEINNKDAAIEIFLEAVKINPAAKDAKLLVYESDCQRLMTHSMNKENQLFSVSFDHTQEPVKSVVYRLAVGNDLLVPTNADGYIYDCDRFYAVNNIRDKKVNVEFDLAKFPVYSESKKIKSENNIEKQIEFLSKINVIEEKMANAYASISGGSTTKITADDLQPDFNKITKMLAETPCEFYKQITYASYIKIAGSAFMTANSELIDKKILAAAIASIDFKSPLWKYYIGSMGVAVTAKQVLGDEYSNYFDSLMLSNPYPEIREDFVFQSLVFAYTRGEKTKVRSLYEHLFVYFPESQYLSSAKQLLDKIEDSMVGEKAPIFNIDALDDSNIKLSNEHFKGKYLLIDFWATWCGPCVREMPHLHDAYEKYNGKIEFLSMSLDKTTAQIAEFRGKKWKMPWNHAFLPSGFSNIIATRFKVKSIPKPVLINPDGIIVAEGAALRGANLINTLKMNLEGK
jgi:thiol-disulfide isomerase/thioredoxin